MAEVLGVIASGISVVQLAGQLLGCVQQLRTFCRSIRNFSEELHLTLDELEALGKVFAHVETFDEHLFPVQGRSFLQVSLQNCQAAASALETLTVGTIQPLDGKCRFRPKHLLKAVLRKDEAKELKMRLDSASRMLHLAMTCYSTQLQQRQLALLERGSIEFSSAAEESVSVDEPEFISPKRRRIKPAFGSHSQLYHGKVCFINRCCCACHDTKSYQGRSWSLKLPTAFWFWKQCDNVSCGHAKNLSFWFGLTQFGVPWAFCASLNVMFTYGQSYITPSLGFQSVVRRTSPGFKLLWELQNGLRGDWPKAKQDLLELFESRKASPRDIDPDGNTWLEKILYAPWTQGNRDIQFSLFYMLAQMGTQLNTLRLLYRSVKWIGEGPHMALLQNLLYFGFDASEIEAPSFSLWPQPCSPDWIAEDMIEDPFFIEWISENLKVCPGFAGMNPLLEAILIESRDEVKRLLTKISPDDENNLLGQSAIHLAVSRPQHLDSLLSTSANVNVRDRHGITPLMYATAMGKSDVAIRLLESGAHLFATDTLRKRNSLLYAVARGHWTTIIDILCHICHSGNLSTNDVLHLLTYGLLLWVHAKSRKKSLKHLINLLELGADPNITHINEAGAHVLISASKNHDPRVIKLILDSGSDVNNQNNDGYAALHLVAYELRSSLLVPFDEDDWAYNERSNILDSTRLLLSRGADPYLGDNCQCACSRAGCTPTHLVLKDNHAYIISRRKDIWILEYLNTVAETCGFETAKQCLLDVMRRVKFEELELTHTCCRESDFTMDLERVIDDEEIAEILDEEKELVEILNQEMSDVERSLGSDLDLDQLLLEAIFQLSPKWKFREQSKGTENGVKTKADGCTKPRVPMYEVDYKRDDFIIHYSTHWIPEPAHLKDTIEIRGYAAWIEHKKSKMKKDRGRYSDADEKWYMKRVGWISRIKSMEESIEKEKRRDC